LSKDEIFVKVTHNGCGLAVSLGIWKTSDPKPTTADQGTAVEANNVKPKLRQTVCSMSVFFSCGASFEFKNYNK